MAALSADARVTIRASNDTRFIEPAIVTSQVVYNGSLCNYVVSTKRVRVATAAASRKFAGLHMGPTSTGNTAGTVRAKLAYNCEAKLTARTALTSAYIGADACISSDNEVTTGTAAGTAGVQVSVGQITEFETGYAWVWLRGFRGVKV